MDVSCAFPPGTALVDLGLVAERVGYRRIWCYDSPALYCDVWMSLARLAERTETIGLGPGVLVPSLRHPMVTAAAIATLEAFAPGRTRVAIGSGFTGRLALGRPPVAWADVAGYVGVLRSLLAGEEAAWDGAVVRMMQPPGFGAPRPVDVPILIGADGPKGYAVAEDWGDGVMARRVPRTSRPLKQVSLIQIGTVLEPGEHAGSKRVLQSVGPGAMSFYHSAYEVGGAGAVIKLPGGDRWLACIEQTPPERRHLAVHVGHATNLNVADQLVLEECAPLIESRTLTGDATEIRRKIDALAALGVSEIVYQPAGLDLERELVAMARAVGLSEVAG
jgi:5,10-methylenetetrahydromethanopterin reductase